jgi:hypothetical protein
VTASLSATSAVPVTVALVLSGSASPSVDYTCSASRLVIGVGSSSGSVTIRSVQDAYDESNETVVVSCGEILNGVAGEPSAVSIVIVDDDPAPTVSLSGPGTFAFSEAWGNVKLTAQLSALSGQPVTVHLSCSGTAAQSEDYELSGDRLTIPAGSLRGSIVVRALQDTLAEGLETVTVDVVSVENGTESGEQRVALSVVDDDQHWVGIGERVWNWTNAEPADRVRLGVRDAGVYRVPVGELAQASGWSADTVLEALNTGGLDLRCQTGPARWTTDGEALYFYGVPTAEPFAPENVYWVRLGTGVRMELAAALPSVGATNAWFMHAEPYRSAFLAPYEPRDRRSTNGLLTNTCNFGEWIPTSPLDSSNTQSRVVVLPGYCATATTGVTARVSLVSYHDFTEPDVHTCEIRINGVSCGARTWSGEQGVTFEYAVPAGAVTNDTVQVSVRNAAGSSSVSDFMLVELVLVYPRDYAAGTGQLLCAGGSAPTVRVLGEGEAGSPGVWDVTEAASPRVLAVSAEPAGAGAWSVAFACGDERSKYAVFAAPGACFAPSVGGVADEDWFAAGAIPELAIIVPPRRWVSGFQEAVQPLAEFRQAQGLETRVIDAEEIYTAFNDGLVHPEAFRRFCAAGVTNGVSQRLRYLLFAGYGGSDYKLEVFRLGENLPYPTLFPLYLLPHIDESVPGAILLPNDTVLGDASGGAVPEVAVGRFLAINADELAHLVSKTIRYELTESWKSKAVFSADWENAGAMYADFSGIAAATASGFSQAGWSITPFYPDSDQSYLGSLWKDTFYETGVFYEFQEGAGFFYYVGHSSDSIAGNSGPNRLFDAATLAAGNWPFAPVALLMGCRMGRWTSLDLKAQSQGIAEAGARNRSSGFTAVITASGYLATSDAISFSQGFSSRIASGALRLGDAWQGAFAALGSETSRRLQHIVLLGDPALCIRADRTARGTATSWLLDQGLTGDPYADLRDPDGDGFATWLELQAGTPYLDGGVRFRGLARPDVAPGSSGGQALPPDAATPGLALTFEVLSGSAYRILSTTDLRSASWQQVYWRPVGGGAWSLAPIDGDWPVKSVEVPFEEAARQRFYKVVSP